MAEFLRKNKWPLLVAAAAVVIRWIYLGQLSAQPGFTAPMVDEKWHWEWALQILDGPFLGEGSWFRAPLYPYFLALLAFITGESIFWSKLLQLLLCGGTAFFVVKLGEHLFGMTAGVVAGLMYALYGTLLYYEAMFLIPVVFLFFTVWGMYRLVAYRESRRAGTWLLTGAVFGLASISRPNILLVIPVLLLWLYLTDTQKERLVRRLVKPAMLVAGMLVIILPVTARNVAVTGDFTLISSQGGVNFYLGNNEVANGLTMRMSEVGLTESLSWRQFQPATHAAAQREAGRDLTEGEASSFWTAKAVDWISNNPGDFIALTWRKFVYLLSGFENSDNSDIYYEREKSSLYSLLLWDKGLAFPFGVLLPLTLLGIYLRRGEWRRLLPLYLFILGYIPTIILFLVTARHRLPLVPFLMVVAAGGLVKLADLVSRKRWATIGVAAVILVASALVFNRTYYEEGGRNDFQIHFNAGIKLERVGDYVGAEREYLRADQYFGSSPALLTNLGHVQYLLGKPEEAAQKYRRALAVNGDFHRALNNLGLLVADQGQMDSALTLYKRALSEFDSQIARENEKGQIFLNMAAVYDRMGRLDSAAAAFSAAIESAPTMSEAYTEAAEFYARHGQHQHVDSLYGEGRRYADLDAADFFNWGLSMMHRELYPQGISMMYRALRQDSTMYQAYYMIGRALYEGNYPADSVQPYLDRTLHFNPQFQPALDLEQLIENEGSGN